MNTTIKSLVFVLVCLHWINANAAIPGSLDYQAYLTNPDGTAVEGNTVITFSIYSAEFGGVPLWTDTQLVIPDQGLFSVTLGDLGNPFVAGMFDTPLYIGIEVNGDGEMLPRRQFASVGFAFEADNALSLQGQGPASFDQSTHVGDTANPHNVNAAQTGAVSSADIANLQSQLDTALAAIAQLQTDLANTQGNVTNNAVELASVQTDLANEIVDRIADVDAEEVARVTADSLQDSAIASIQSNSVLALDGILTHPDPQTALFAGVNLQVNNGTGSILVTNSVGNLIVGYNTADTDDPICSVGNQTTQGDCLAAGGAWASSHKSGSHNIVVGEEHNYSSSGGLVAGFDNNITARWSSVSGGRDNSARADYASVSGGQSNVASANSASVSGGWNNTASNFTASVSGGDSNEASGQSASVVGGNENIASSFYATVSGGLRNTASGQESSVSGGKDAIASGIVSSVSGGERNTASGLGSAVSGGALNEASGSFATIAGGGGSGLLDTNEAFSDYSAILGGRNNTTGDVLSGDRAIGRHATVGGGDGNTASGENTTVSGGEDNTASAQGSSVSGGRSNNATGMASSVSGGRFNDASGSYASVAGGGGSGTVEGNQAYSDYSAVLGGSRNKAGDVGSGDRTIGSGATVSGGFTNTASGQSSSVSGGSNGSVSGTDDWRAGTLFENN